MVHELKIAPKFYEAIICGEKTFEVRKNDRYYRVGDTLMLREFDGKEYTGRICERKVIYILSDSKYVKEGYLIMSLGEII